MANSALIVTLTALILASPLTAEAFYSHSHAFIATEPEHLSLSSADVWDSEASSDFLTYQRPLSWEASYWRSPKVFDLSVGSISSRQFAFYQRLKIEHALTEKLSFQLEWLEERDFEQDRQLMPLALKYRFNEHWSIKAFGQMSLYKAENDAGLSLGYSHGSLLHELSGLKGDFDRNKRNLDTDRWQDNPYSYTLSSHYLPEDKSLDHQRFELQWQPRSIRTQNNAPLYTLQHQSFTWQGYHTTETGRHWAHRVLVDRSFANEHTNSDLRSRKRALAQLEYGFTMGAHRVRPGLALFYRESRVNRDQDIQREALPSIWFSLPPRAKSWGVRTIELGYDLTVFNEDSTRFSPDTKIENRLNVKLDHKFNKAGELALLFTFDVDRFGGEETWEGGAGQFRLEF